jgi:hypothetical protein
MRLLFVLLALQAGLVQIQPLSSTEFKGREENFEPTLYGSASGLDLENVEEFYGEVEEDDERKKSLLEVETRILESQDGADPETGLTLEDVETLHSEEEERQGGGGRRSRRRQRRRRRPRRRRRQRGRGRGRQGGSG